MKKVKSALHQSKQSILVHLLFILCTGLAVFFWPAWFTILALSISLLTLLFDIINIIYIGRKAKKDPSYLECEIERKRMKKPGIILMAEFESSPVRFHDGEYTSDIAVGLLGVSHQLSLDLMLWADEYESRFDWHAPEPCMWTNEEKEAFAKEGRRLALKLHEEVGERYSVFYHDVWHSERIVSVDALSV